MTEVRLKHSQRLEGCSKVPELVGVGGERKECSLLSEGSVRCDVRTAFIPPILRVLVKQKVVISLGITLSYE